MRKIEILEPKRRKGIFFSSSIGLQCDIQKLSNDINSKICIEETYHIEKHADSKDPELFLRNNIKILDQNRDLDFIIISVGSNDITRLNIEEEIKELNEKSVNKLKILLILQKEHQKIKILMCL